MQPIVNQTIAHSIAGGFAIRFQVGLAMVALVLWPTTIMAAEVRVHVSSEETYVGLPVVLQIHIANAQSHQPPVIEPVDGLVIEQAGPPTTFSASSFVRGAMGEHRTITESLVYRFNVTPQRAGTFKVRPIKVLADGVATVTKAVTIVASESVTGDLLRVEVEANEASVYVGEALQLTLRILVKCFVDQATGMRLSEATMWSQLRRESSWGPFSDRMRELQQQRRRPGGSLVVRNDASGEPTEYFAYEIDAKIYPQRAGKIVGDEIRIVMHYPTAIGRTQDPFDDFAAELFSRGMMRGSFFGSQVEVTSVRPIDATATVETVEVLPIPEQGRPKDYRGAVGRYTIITQASPRTCSVGDPIRLVIAIDGTGPMELVRAPALSENKELVAGFKVPDESLAGVVDGQRKVFATTIRPLHEEVTEIPPISYTYFDPQAAEFVTVRSQPIPIEVNSAETLALDEVVSAGPSAAWPRGDDAEAKSAVIPQLDVDQALQNQLPATLWNPSLVMLVASPPLLALLSLALVRRQRCRDMLQRLVPAGREFRRRVMGAATHEEVATALHGYLVRVTGTKESSTNRQSVIGNLRARGLGTVAIEVERLYARCDPSKYGAPRDTNDLAAIKEEALQVVQLFQQSSSEHHAMVTSKRIHSPGHISAMLVGFLWMLGTAEVIAVDPSPSLSSADLRVLLAEANADYRQAVEGSDEEAVEKFALAASKYQVVQEAGILNAELAFAAGQAYEGAAQRGHAIASYLRALRIAPTEHRYRQALFRIQHARDDEGAATVVIPSAGAETWQVWRKQVVGMVPLGLFLTVFALAWIGVWLLITLRWLRYIERCWMPLSAMASLAIVSGWVYLASVKEVTRDGTAVLVSPSVSLREADGPNVPTSDTIHNAEGLVVKELNRRDRWVKIQLGQQSGWVHTHDLAPVWPNH